ncbi:hypothetical protein GGR55DRAFT_691614 [Xylaria sp. FL0064]|nr:hypothetical protein GGR55DRAFT_691614 [Xylaria sp. FL0064]
MKPYEPLKQEADEDEALSSPQRPQADPEDDYKIIERRRMASVFQHWPVAEIALILLVLSNVAWILKSLTRESTLRELSYFGSPDKILVPFDHDWLNLTDEGLGGMRYADDKWKGMIPHESTIPTLSLPNRSVIRDQLYEPTGLTSMSDLTKRDHVLHCVEAVRQALYCFLDTTLINLEAEWPHVPNGQKHVCRNRDALASWAQAHRSGMPGEEP